MSVDTRSMVSLRRASARSMSRRELLRVGSLGLMGLSLPRLFAAQALGEEAQLTPRADACIVIFLNGGPSHLDMWDMKPNAPSEIRGVFSPIATSVPGVQLCEHLPRLAKLMHHTTLVRSMHHSVNNSHAAAVYAALTGHDRGEQGGGFKPDDHPPPGSVVSKLRPPTREAGASPLSYVTLPYKTKEGAGGPLQPGFLAGFLGASYDPYWVLDDPNDANFAVRNLTPAPDVAAERVASRGELLTKLDERLRQRRVGASAFEAMDDFQHRAFDLLTSERTRRAFEISREPAEVRDRYGRNIYGQSVLLARRLIEAGTRFVTMSWAPDANATWDTHGGNFTKLKDPLLPQFDAACSSLLEDLVDRRMLDRTLVAVLGDFGRTPKINGNGGRDHWNNCYTVMLAGGGIKGGYVFGASDKFGSLPTERPVAPADIIATMYQLVGIDGREVIYDRLDRPHPIVGQGAPVHELIA